ncbi:DNA-directed RNA polymerase specialized sigma24 family protein [Rhodoligotrophos appendicifer]|uniref:response regulator n=1 Tax=Rhodoligotrophos appendicifer TaxID=987056 RepID=UPI001186C9B2|nr:response regulator [Rhodoligotrophos appendicifer]
MSLSERVAPNIPYLRRFARALCGNQASGDAYVAATLEAIIADPPSFDEIDDAKVSLFSIFLRIWESLDVNQREEAPPTSVTGQAERRLERLAPRPRQAFLLTAVEGFSPEEARVILNVSAKELDQLIDQAGREIAEQVATDILIIEDEPIIAMDLEALVEGLGHKVSGIARTHSEAVHAVRTQNPGLILADIQLADGSSGLEAVNEILGDLEVPVIFITAYPERLLTGDRPEPTFLITKPFQADMVKAMISQALFFDTRARKRGEAA